MKKESLIPAGSSEEIRTLYELVGEDTFIMIAAQIGGGPVHIPSMETVQRWLRNRSVKDGSASPAEKAQALYREKRNQQSREWRQAHKDQVNAKQRARRAAMKGKG